MVPETARAARVATLGLSGALRGDGLAEVRRAGRDPSPKVRAAAVAALVRSGPVRVAATAWATAVGDPDPGVRRRAAEVAPALSGRRRSPDPTVTSALVVLLDDRDVTIVEAASWALGELGPVAGRAAVDALTATAVGHPDPLAREAAVAALGAIGDDAGLPAILAACGDKPAVRRRAVLALAPFAGPEVEAAIAAALDDRDWQVRQAAEDLGPGGASPARGISETCGP